MPDQDFSKYSENQLKLAYWYTKNRVKIKAIVMSVLFLGLGVLLFFNIISIFNYYSEDEIKIIQADVLDLNVWDTLKKNNYQPKPLIWQPVQIVHRGKDAYDLVVEVENPNIKWAVEDLAYIFKISNWQSEIEHNYLLPQQKRRLVYLNISAVDISLLPTQELRAQISVDAVEWNRIKDTKFFADNKFIGSGLAVGEGVLNDIGQSIRELNFEAINNSDFNYNEVEATVFLFNGPNIIAVNLVNIPKLVTNEKRQIAVRWFNEMPVATKWEVDLSTNNILESNILRFDIEQFN